MKSGRVLLVILAFGATPSAFAGFQGYTTLSHSDTRLTSATDVSYIFDSVICPECSYQMMGDHWIRESNGGGAITGQQWGVYGTEYRNTLTAEGATGACYFATNAASMTLYGCTSCPAPAPGGPWTFDHGGPWESSSACIPAPAPPVRYRLEVWTCLNGSCTLNNNDLHDAGTTVAVYTSGPSNYRFDGWSGDLVSPNMIAEVYVDRDKSVTANWSSPPPAEDPPCFDSDPAKCTSPIILNLYSGAYRLSTPEEGVLFDLNVDGVRERTAWTNADTSMVFLALDKNLNGTIDDGAELFGNHTPLASGAAPNGFVALASYDSDRNGRIDSRDAIWSELLLWCDLNHDGFSQAGEISHISDSAVTAIDLSYHWSGRRDSSGNTFGYEGTVQFGNKVRPCYDVYLVAR